MGCVTRAANLALYRTAPPALKRLHSMFEAALAVCEEEVEFTFSAIPYIPWSDFLLNPRRLRGSDFLMRWSQGRWSEERLRDALGASGRYFALPYGPSGTAPADIQALEEYFERLERAGLGKTKRPDLLVFPIENKSAVEQTINRLGGVAELPFVPEDNPRMAALLRLAFLALECENSLWIAKKMPDFRLAPTPQRRLGGKLGFPKNVVLPTIILKAEDLEPLRKWQQEHGLPVHIWHAFYDVAYGISFSEAWELIAAKHVEPTYQTFQAPGGPTTKKITYKIPYCYGYLVGETVEDPILQADQIVDKNGHILPYVRFEGGQLKLADECQRLLVELASGRRR